MIMRQVVYVYFALFDIAHNIAYRRVIGSWIGLFGLYEFVHQHQLFITLMNLFVKALARL